MQSRYSKTNIQYWSPVLPDRSAKFSNWYYFRKNWLEKHQVSLHFHDRCVYLSSGELFDPFDQGRDSFKQDLKEDDIVNNSEDKNIDLKVPMTNGEPTVAIESKVHIEETDININVVSPVNCTRGT